MDALRPIDGPYLRQLEVEVNGCQRPRVLVLRQLFLSLRPTATPAGLVMQNGYLNAEYPLDTAWGQLGLLEKISIIYRFIHQSGQQMAPSLTTEGLEAYRRRVWALTDGVVTAYQLCPYFVMRMLIFAGIEKMAEERDQIGPALLRLFNCLDKAAFLDQELTVEAIEEITKQKESIETVILRVQKYRQDPTHKPICKWLDRSIEILHLLRQAILNPLCFFPILLAPISTQRSSLEALNHVDVNYMHPDAALWLQDFYHGWRYQEQLFFDAIPGETRVRRTSELILEEARQMNEKIIRQLDGLRAFKKLTLQDQQPRFSYFDDLFRNAVSLVTKANELQRDHHDLREKLLRLNKRQTSTLSAMARISYPIHFYIALTHGLITSLTRQRFHLQEIRKSYPHLVADKSPHMPVIDILDFRVRTACLRLREEVDTALVEEIDLSFNRLFMGMRSFFACLRTDAGEFDQQMTSFQLIGQIGQLIPLLKPFSTPDSELLNKVIAFLMLAFFLDHWPAMLGKNSKSLKPVEEKQFLFEMFVKVRQSFLLATESCLEGMQERERQRPAPALNEFERRARLWLREMSEIIAHLEEQEESEEVARICELLNARFISPCQELVRFLIREDLVGEEAQRPPQRVSRPLKRKPASPSVAHAAAVAASERVLAPPIIVNEEKKQKSISEICQELKNLAKRHAKQHEGFTNVATGKEERLATRHINNVIHALTALLEGIHSLQKDATVFATARSLEMAVLLEQSAKWVQALKNGQQPLLQSHEPLQFFQTLEVPLTPTQKEWLTKLARTISISSRYLGAEAMENELPDAFNNPRAFMREGLDICQLLLTSIPSPTTSNEFIDESLEIPAELIPENLNLESERTFVALEKLLARLQLRRLIPAKRQVCALSDKDASCQLRSRTIGSALRGLEANIQFARELLQLPEDPARCLLWGKAALLREAVSYELVLLLILSQAAYPSPTQSNCHYLWEEGAEVPERYRHHIQRWAEAAPKALAVDDNSSLVQAMQARTKALEPYLKELYRYSQEPIACEVKPLLDKLTTLSVIRQRRLAQGHSCEELDQTIRALLRSQVKLPLLSGLQNVLEWLMLFERQLD